MHGASSQSKSKKAIAWVFAIVAIMFALMVYQLGSPERLSKTEARQLGLLLFDEPRSLNPVDLIQASAEVFTIDDFEGQWNLLFFGFTHCPDICPTTMATLADAKIGAQQFPQVWLVTVDPDRDTPAQLVQYLKKFDRTFSGITGSIQHIKALAKQVHVAVGHKPDAVSTGYNVDHSSSLVLVDSSGRHAGYIKAPLTAANLQSIMRELYSI
jgi:protein SCO1/2